ncbi:MAG: NAD-dependent epimerase/dehydratase family protein [Mesorhizobium sp.]|uniref:NAD-dependent epimerase/dehydratase family protein n=1 Tax=Mesorhizobium sp. TaxID=1871066 RepID=UPI000FE9028E|nr:NAD-dependent epimerase/dehydratase family protein [Mesorhizobium sp.]RWL99104.1 MAG: NAD-dependent epimerase/dehydratase family protein [Mesorhizobium sp.]TIP50348.1 MAG: NAD-dependent epimerase/dehydratase family protein [Mesorhizobium sp.]
MIAVYGSNGFIGRHLLRRLTQNGVPVRAVSRRFDSEFSSSLGAGAEFVQSDFLQPIAMASSLEGIETVVQLISTSSPGLRNEHTIADIEENVIPHVKFLQACLQAGVKRYIFLSSGGTIYGPDAVVPTPETSAPNPINSHGLTKLIVERYIQMYGYVDGLEYVILRLANPYGPGQLFRKGQGLVPMLLDHWRKRLPIRIFGDGKAMRDYVYIDDVIDAIEAALLLPPGSRAIINIGSGETRSVLEVVEAIEGLTGYVFEREYVGPRNTDVDIASLDISLAEKMLSWRPLTSFDVGIRRTVTSAK